MQRNPERTGVWPPKPMHVPNLRAVYDAMQDGRITVSWKVAASVGGVSACPWGECVSSAAGGLVVGWDYLGQMTSETVGIGATSTKAFAYLSSAPDDIAWAEQYGAPYKMHGTPALDDISGSTVVLTAPATDEDERGTWGSAATAGDWVEFSYACDTTNLHGDAYVDLASGELGSDPQTATGTLTVATGACSIVVGVPTSTNGNITVVWGDGTTTREVTDGSTPITYTLNPLWMSKYAGVVLSDAAAIDALTAVTFDDTAVPGLYVDYTAA